MPVDLEPVPDGLVVVIPLPAGRQGHGRITAESHHENLLDEPGPRYRSHFASCPQADQHRKPRRPGRRR
jgi:hypothetical protein